MPGEHTICLFTNTTAWFSGQQLRVHFEMTTGEHVINYAEVAQQEKLSEIQLRIRQLLNQVDQILKEQNYQRVSLIIISIEYRAKQMSLSLKVCLVYNRECVRVASHESFRGGDIFFFVSRRISGFIRLIVIVVFVLVSRGNVPSDQREHI